MATLSAAGGVKLVTLTGTGYAANSRVPIAVEFSAAGRRYNEIQRVTADANGAVTLVVPVPYAGSVTARAVNMATGAIDATTGTATVT